ncbi:MAG TPA: hypothetical protein DD490_12190 [Acidobacteria bacterium]|nr:hypothetical protein [Acidobacteriota bacterium]
MFGTLKHPAIATLTVLTLTGLALPAQAQSDLPQPGELALRTARAYREQARYPESSRVLRAGEADPVRTQRTPTKQSRRGPEGAGPELSVWASQVSVEVGKPIDLYAELLSLGEPSLPLEVNGEIAGPAGEIVAQVAYRDDGRTPDRRAGDGIWSARLTLPAGLEPDGAAPYMVRTTARLLDGDLRQAAGGFLYSNPSARLTGRYRDTVKDGNLILSAEVDVREAGRFHLSGTLYSLQGEPIGTAQAAAQLEPGRRWIRLSFYGLMFHDRKVAGPYRLGSLALATAGRMPMALNDLVENAYVTKGYKLGAMTAAPFADPKLLEAAARLDLDGLRAQADPTARE